MTNKKIWIVKLGSALLSSNINGLNTELINSLTKQVSSLRMQNINVVLVSSGSIAEGVYRLGLNKRPDNIHKLQAVAAIGQMGLIQTYEYSFAKHNIRTAQILLTHDNLKDSEKSANFNNTLQQLLAFNVVPIINENDTVATEEICFGDNDILSALVASIIKADKLIIMTDQLGVFDADPAINKNAKLIEKINVNNPILKQVAGKVGGILGKGGMYSKVIAAEVASNSNIATHIVYGRDEEALLKIAKNIKVGTIIT